MKLVNDPQASSETQQQSDPPSVLPPGREADAGPKHEAQGYRQAVSNAEPAAFSADALSIDGSNNSAGNV